MVGASPTPGFLAPASDRTLLVLAGDGELAVALREQLDGGLILIKDARPGEAEHALASCRPWPWMLVGALPALPARVADSLRRPVLVIWYGPSPLSLPTHARRFARFPQLLDAVRSALAGEVAGIRLAAGSGVDLPSGTHSRSAELQALVSAGSSGFDLPLATFRSAARVLARGRVPARPSRDPRTRHVSLRSAPR